MDAKTIEEHHAELLEKLKAHMEVYAKFIKVVDDLEETNKYIYSEKE